MTRLVLAAAVLVVAACKMEEKPADPMRIDTAAPAMAPAPTDAMMRDSMMRDSMMKDSVAKAMKKKA